MQLRRCWFYLLIPFLTACATSAKVERVKMTDAALSCDDLSKEFAEAERFRQEAEGKKGFTGTNVASVVFFWPGLLMTYSDSNDAIRAADERKAYIVDLLGKKGCRGQPVSGAAGEKTQGASETAVEGGVQGGS